jgi:hypothetical protein
MLDLRFKDGEKVSIISSIISIMLLISVISAMALIFGKVWEISRNLNKEKVIQYKINYSVLTE